MSSKNDGDYKKFVKIRIRKDDNIVDNDLSSDDEKWMDKFDTEVRKAREVDPAVLPRCQLIPYVQSVQNVKKQKKLIQEFEISDEELKLKPKSVKVPPELIKGTENIDPELKEYIMEHVHLSSSSSSTSATTCSTCSCSCSTSPSTGDKLKDNKKVEGVGEDTKETAQSNVMSPMRLYLMKTRTPSSSDTSSLPTYKSSWQCTSTSSSSMSSSTTLQSEQPLQDNYQEDICQSQVKPLVDICKNIVVDVFEKAKIGLPPTIAHIPYGKENQPPEKRVRRRSTKLAQKRRSSSSPEEKKASKHSSDMSLTPVVSRSPQLGRILRSSSRSSGSVSSSKSTLLKRAGKSSKKETLKKFGLGDSLGSASMSLTPKESPSRLESVSEATSSSYDSSTIQKKSKLSLVTTRDIENTTLPLATSMVLRSSSRSNTTDSDSTSNQTSRLESVSEATSSSYDSSTIQKKSKLSLVTTRDIENTTLPLATSMVLRSSSRSNTTDSDSTSNQTSRLESVSEATSSSYDSSTIQKKSKLSLVTTRDIENTTLPLATSMVLRSSSRSNTTDSDSTSNQTKKSTTTTSITTSSLSASEDSSSLNSLTSLTHAKMVTSTPLETPLLSPSSQKDGKSENLILSNETSFSSSRKSKNSSSSRKSKSRPSFEYDYYNIYSPISSRLRSQTRKEHELMSSPSISPENTSSGKTRPKSQYGAKYGNLERSPQIEEIYLPAATGMDSSTSEEVVDSDNDRMAIIFNQDNSGKENKQRSISVIKEYRTPLGNQLTITTDYSSAEGTVTGVQVTVKLEEDVPEVDMLADCEPNIKTEGKSSTQSIENEMTIKTEDNAEYESLSNSQLTVKTEDSQTVGTSTTDSQITIKSEDYTNEDDQSSQAEDQTTEQNDRTQDLLDLDQITIKTESSQCESLPDHLSIRDEDAYMEQDLDMETSLKYETEDTDFSQEESLESQESQVTVYTEQDFQEESQLFDNSEQNFQGKRCRTNTTVDSSPKESRSSNSSPPIRRKTYFENRNYGFENPESLQSAVDEFIKLVRTEMDKEDDLLKKRKMKKSIGKKMPDETSSDEASDSDQTSDSDQASDSDQTNSSAGNLPYERFLPSIGTPDSFTALISPSERLRLLREREMQRDAAENWKLSLNSLINLDDEQLLSRCLPSDDQQGFFNLLSPRSDDQMSIRSMSSTESTTCELFFVNNRLVERFSDDLDDDNASSYSDSIRSYRLFETEQGMALRSGRIIPGPNDFTFVVDNLAALFGKMSLKDKELKAAKVQSSPEETTQQEDEIKPPEPVYLSLRGRQVRLKTEHITNIVYQVHRLEIERNNRKLGLKKRMKRKKPKKRMTELEKLLELKAQMINMRSTRSSTWYSYGKDCTHLAPKTETQKHPTPVNCTMNCGKKKRSTCTSTGEPVCSYKCYKKNISRCKDKIRGKLKTEDHIHIIFIEHEVDELPEASTSGVRFVPQRNPESEKAKEKVSDDQSEAETIEESEVESSDNYEEEESEEEDED